MTPLSRFCAGALLLALFGCAGPDYAGGPTGEDPHGIVDPENDVSIWRVDGFDTLSRNSSIKVAPGLRRIKVRIEFPIENESATPYEYRDLDLRVAEGHVYTIGRKEVDTEIDLGPPYDLEIRDYAPR